MSIIWLRGLPSRANAPPLPPAWRRSSPGSTMHRSSRSMAETRLTSKASATRSNARSPARVDGPAGLVSRLRSQPVIPGRPPLRLRYIVWHDPDGLIKNDSELFGRVADAIAGVSAEAEYTSDDLLLITRAVYIGGQSLRDYAADESGQLQSWLRDGAHEPFWRAVSGVEKPPVLTGRIGELLADPEAIAHNALMASLGELAY